LDDDSINDELHGNESSMLSDKLKYSVGLRRTQIKNIINSQAFSEKDDIAETERTFISDLIENRSAVSSFVMTKTNTPDKFRDNMSQCSGLPLNDTNSKLFKELNSGIDYNSEVRLLC
jgi:aspartate/glutamate racemase